jgi:adenine deaminase
MADIKKIVDIAMGREKAPLVLKNALIINVFNQVIEKSDIAICDDIIVGIGNYEGIKEINCEGMFAAPGFIDSHVHIESSMVTPEVFSHIALEHGVTTVIADPHEIANVMGDEGIDFMLANSKKSVIDIFFMLPSCVPATEFEDSGAVLKSFQLSRFIQNDRILGLGEVMDVQAVTSVKRQMVDKLELCKNKNIDGHCPRISEKALNAYLSCDIKTDHECVTCEEAEKKVERGMFVMLREGSATKNLKDILPAVKSGNYNRFLFCTDDRHIEDLLLEGSIDNCIRLAAEEGLEPIKAYTIAAFNAAQCYGLKDRGAIAPGYKADLVLFKNLKELNIEYVFKNGVLNNKEMSFTRINMKSTMNTQYINSAVFRIEAKGQKVNVIKLIPHSVETLGEIKKIYVKDGYIDKVDGEDILKIGIFERHKNTGKYSVGFLEGLGLRNCSIAQTISHDSHNIVVVGDNDKDMEVAVNTLIAIGGGIVVVSQGKILDSLSLPIAGLITSENPYEVNNKLKNLSAAARKYGVHKDFDPFLTLGFMALSVIPKLKITSRGLFDYEKFNFIDLFAKE